MMKKINFSIMSFLLIFAVMSCEKDRTFVEFDDLEKGAYARELSRSGSFFLTDVDNSKFDVSVEFYDENQGRNVSEYSWAVEYIDKVNGGADNAGPVNLLSIPASQFTTNPDTGLPMTSFTFTLQQVLDAFGFTTDDVTGGSTFRFNGTITMNDGRTFSAANTGNNIISSAAFKALFSFDGDLLCTSDIGGTFDYVSTELVTPNGPCDPSTTTGTVTWTEVEEGIYETTDFSFGNFATCYGDTGATSETARITDSCNFLGTLGADQYGDSYTYSVVSIDGPVLTLTWTNTFDDGGTVVLTRQDGMDWPALK